MDSEVDCFVDSAEKLVDMFSGKPGLFDSETPMPILFLFLSA